MLLHILEGIGIVIVSTWLLARVFRFGLRTGFRDGQRDVSYWLLGQAIRQKDQETERLLSKLAEQVMNRIGETSKPKGT
jgi:hypothetical protein